MSIAVRTAVMTDVDAIMSVEKTGISHPWTRDSIESLINDDNKVALVACDGEEVVGYVYASYVLDEAEIGNICLLPDRRGEGIGRMLMDAMAKFLLAKGVTKIFLEVEEGNAPALRLYGKCGFVMYNRRKDYYGEGRDALLYSAALNASSGQI